MTAQGAVGFRGGTLRGRETCGGVAGQPTENRELSQAPDRTANAPKRRVSWRSGVGASRCLGSDTRGAPNSLIGEGFACDWQRGVFHDAPSSTRLSFRCGLALRLSADGRAKLLVTLDNAPVRLCSAHRASAPIATKCGRVPRGCPNRRLGRSARGRKGSRATEAADASATDT